MKYEYITSELKSITHWVCWRAIPDANFHSGIRKVPINPLTGGQVMCYTERAVDKHPKIW